MRIQITKEVILFAAATALSLHFAMRSSEKQKGRAIALFVLAAVFASVGLGFFYHRQMKADAVSWIKAMIALSACGLSIYEGRRIQEGNPIPRHLVKGAALGMAALALAAHVRFGDYGYSQFYHRWEFFHYFLGSKYNRELQYEGLYKCTAVAQFDLGQVNEVRARKLRNLHDDVLESTKDSLDHGDECRSRFTPERWEKFKEDVKWFRASSDLKYWNDMQKDHGYNPPPVWTVTGNLLASLQPASGRFITLLAAIDPLLYLGMFSAIYWAYGWRIFAAAMIFWGCQLPAEYFWTGGAFLRQDWLFYLVLSSCLVRKKYYFLAGSAFAYSVLLRIFPGPILAGWLVVMVAHWWKHKRIARSHLRVIAGGLTASALLLTSGMAIAGKDSYKEFWAHITVHNSTPLTNNMGLPIVLSHSVAGRMETVRDDKLVDPFSVWKDMRRERLHAFRFLHILIIGAVAGAFIYVVKRVRGLWIAQALSVAFVVCLVELTCYYYSMFILAAFLSRIRRGFEQSLFWVAAVSQLLVVNKYISYYYDDRYTAQSLLFLVYSIGLIVALWPRARKAAEGILVPSKSQRLTDPPPQPASAPV